MIAPGNGGKMENLSSALTHHTTPIMKSFLRFMDWPLRAKMAALLIVAALLPLVIAAVIDIRQARQRLVASTADLLAARGDQLTNQLDAFHRTYLLSTEKFTRLPLVLQFCRARPDEVDRLRPTLGGVFDAHLGTDPNVLGLLVLDLAGTVQAATEPALVGKSVSRYPHVKAALRGVSLISNVHIAESYTGDVPAIAYLAPVLDSNGTPVAVAMLWVRARALWEIMKGANELAGSGSFAVLFDQQG